MEEKVIVKLYFGNNVDGVEDTVFVMDGDVTTVVNTLLGASGKQPVEIDEGFKIINFDNVCWMDVIKVKG
jgi:hypothetical protein